jgi:hypothetical protein
VVPENSTHPFDNVLLVEVDALTAFSIEEKEPGKMSRQKGIT